MKTSADKVPKEKVWYSGCMESPWKVLPSSLVLELHYCHKLYTHHRENKHVYETHQGTNSYGIAFIDFPCSPSTELLGSTFHGLSMQPEYRTRPAPDTLPLYEVHFVLTSHYDLCPAISTAKVQLPHYLSRTISLLSSLIFDWNCFTHYLSFLSIFNQYFQCI